MPYTFKNGSTNNIYAGYRNDMCASAPICKPLLSCLGQSCGFTIQFPVVNENCDTQSGAIFILETSCGQKIAGVSDKNGKVIFPAMGPGKYRLYEYAAAAGYEPIDRDFIVKVGCNGVVTIDGEAVSSFVAKNRPSQKVTSTALGFYTKDSHTGEPLKGAKFTLSMNNGLTIEATSNEYGHVKFPNVHPGIYALTETSAPDGYELDPMPHHVAISEDGASVIDGQLNLSYVFKNTASLSKGTFAFRKVDSNTNIGLPGSVFVLKNDQDSIVASAISNNSGWVEFTGVMPGSYSLQEYHTPNGYETMDPMHAIVSADGGIEIDGVPATDFVARNTQKPTVTLDFLKVDENNAPLPNAEFSLIDEGGKVIATAVSDATGIVTFPNLSEGSYAIKESAPPAGYIDPNETHAIIVSSNGSVTFDGSSTTENFKVQNERRATFTFKKFASWDFDDRGGDTPAPGCTFQLRTLEVDGNKLLETAVSDAQGNVKFTNIPTNASYQVIETSKPDNLLMPDDPRFILVVDDQAPVSFKGSFNDNDWWISNVYA